MANTINYMSELEPDEMAYVQNIMANMTDAQAQQFTNIYRTRRKEPQLILLLTLLGFFGFAGVHRFLIGDIGLGILYFFTGGLCVVGTIVDLLNHKRLAFEYNIKQAQYALAMMGGHSNNFSVGI